MNAKDVHLGLLPVFCLVKPSTVAAYPHVAVSPSRRCTRNVSGLDPIGLCISAYLPQDHLVAAITETPAQGGIAIGSTCWACKTQYSVQNKKGVADQPLLPEARA